MENRIACDLRAIAHIEMCPVFELVLCHVGRWCKGLPGRLVQSPLPADHLECQRAVVHPDAIQREPHFTIWCIDFTTSIMPQSDRQGRSDLRQSASPTG